MSTCNAWHQKNIDLQNKYQLATDIHITAIIGKENKYVNIAFFSEVVFPLEVVIKVRKIVVCSSYFEKVK